MQATTWGGKPPIVPPPPPVPGAGNIVAFPAGTDTDRIETDRIEKVISGMPIETLLRNARDSLTFVAVAPVTRASQHALYGALLCICRLLDETGFLDEAGLGSGEVAG